MRPLYLLIAVVWLAGSSSADVFDQALEQVGLSKATARFNPLDLHLYGSGAYRLPFFDSLHLDPWRSPYTAAAVRAESLQNASKPSLLLSSASLRLSEGTRRNLLGDPTAKWKQQAEQSEQPLLQAIQAVYAAVGEQLPVNAPWLPQISTVPLPLQRQVAYLLLTALEARRWRELALRQAFASTPAQQLYEMFCQPPERIDRLKDAFNTAFWSIVRDVDLKALFVGAQDLLIAAEQTAKELQSTSLGESFRLDIPTPLGDVAIRDSRDDIYQNQSYLLIVDMGGDDTYLGVGGNASASHPLALIIDVRGNDRYLQSNPLADRRVADFAERRSLPIVPGIAGGLLGYAILLDLEGDDLYRTLTLSQGAALFGVGVLVDGAGNDHYEAYLRSQASAEWGIGILIDQGGNDRYYGFSQVQGYGGTKGYGALIDVSGNDQYVAEDSVIDFPSPQTDKHNVSLAQGAGCGRRADYSDGHSLAGGIGVLVDGSGDDRYSCGVFGQGVGYWYGLGMLLDGGGNDLYEGVWYVQGASAHFAVGLIEDVLGDDRYIATINMAQGAGHDFAVGWLIDRAGNDLYRAPNLSLGAGNANGIGLFWEIAGDDRYETTHPLALGRSSLVGLQGSLREQAICLGLFCDTGGVDSYPESLPFARDNALWKQPGASQPPLPREYGVGIDTHADPAS